MKENLLQFIWQKQLFVGDLFTDKGNRLKVLFPGTLNSLSGPDFLNARIIIDDLTWVGNIEIHVSEKDWFLHKHDKDPAYDNIILHVICEKGFEKSKTGHLSLNLFPHLDEKMLDRYNNLMSSFNQLPCKHHVGKIEEIKMLLWINSLGIERLENKLQGYKSQLEESNYNLDVLLMRLLFKAFGFSMNTQGFDQLASKLNPSYFLRLKNEPTKAHILLKGTAGFKLSNEEEITYSLLQKRFKIEEIQSSFWKRGSLRPANSPEKRIAQLANLMLHFEELKTKIQNRSTLKELSAFFDKKQLSDVPKLGHSSRNGLIINALVPYLFLYAEMHQVHEFKDYSLELLENIKAEKNKYTRLFEKNGFSITNALESQALLQLYRNYCRPKKCLNCAIGNDLLLSND